MATSEDAEGGERNRSQGDGAVWRYENARRATLVIDGADYFDLMQQAMLKARQRIL